MEFREEVVPQAQDGGSQGGRPEMDLSFWENVAVQDTQQQRHQQPGSTARPSRHKAAALGKKAETLA